MYRQFQNRRTVRVEFAAVSEGCYGCEISGALVLNKKSYILEGNYS